MRIHTLIISRQTDSAIHMAGMILQDDYHRFIRENLGGKYQGRLFVLNRRYREEREGTEPKLFNDDLEHYCNPNPHVMLALMNGYFDADRYRDWYKFNEEAHPMFDPATNISKMLHQRKVYGHRVVVVSETADMVRETVSDAHQTIHLFDGKYAPLG